MFGSQRSNGLDAILSRRPLSPWQQFWERPIVHLVQKLLSWQKSTFTTTRPTKDNNAVSVVCISDTHNNQPDLPHGDILIHAGDLTDGGTLPELQATLDWLRSQPHRHKVVIAGNHDLLLDSSYRKPRDLGFSEQKTAERAQLEWGDIVYLQDSATTVQCGNGRRLKIYGSPRTPRLGSWAFQYPRGEDVWEKAVPDDVNVLVTHGPPRAHLDLLNLGCDHLLRELWRVRPRLHVFGHVHAGRGQEWVPYSRLQEVYERAFMQRGGLANLAMACWQFVLDAFWTSGPRTGSLLVNAAIVGGFRDGSLRDPIKVYI